MPFLTIEPSIECIKPHARVILSPCLLGRLHKAQHRGRTFALPVVRSLIVAPVVACAPPSTVSPLGPTTVSTIGPSPNPVLPCSKQKVDSVNRRGMVERN